MSHVFPRHSKLNPPTAVSGEGCYLIDSTGKRYLDGSGGAAVSCLGHGDAEVTAAIKAQLDELAFAHTGFFTSEPAEALAADWEPAEGQGEYVLHASDCVACHTSDDGESLAGGRAIASPMGTIWSTNITPDPETGIGDWSYADFRAAMIDGLEPDGTHLYPAMPYENYRLMTEEDIRALYEYIMTEVEPVSNEVQETELSFPFNLRFGIRAWNWLALTGQDEIGQIRIARVILWLVQCGTISSVVKCGVAKSWCD